MLAIRAILHPTDFSGHSQAAFRLACSLARDHGARLVVLHAVPAGTVELLALSQLGTQERTKGIRDSYRSDLARIQPTDPDVRVEHRLEDGNPATVILRVAEEIPADLVVMGTHGRSRTGLSRLLMGSVAEQVVRHATCPVLTVRLPVSRDAEATKPTTVEVAGE
jgi:universal stress protein A